MKIAGASHCLSASC